MQKHLHIKAASRSEHRHSYHGGVLPLRVTSSHSTPGEIIVLPQGKSFRNTYVRRRRDLKTIILPTGGVFPNRGRSSYSPPGKSFPTRGDHHIHFPPGDGVSPHRGRLSYSPQGGEPFPTGGVLPHRGRPSYSPKGSLSPTGETIQPPQRESKQEYTRITKKQVQTNRTRTNKNQKG